MSNPKAYQLSILSGILLGVCWNGVLPAISLFVAFVPLLFVFRIQTWHYRQVFMFGLLAFFIFHLGTVWWLTLSSFLGGVIIFLLNSMVMAAVVALAYKIRQALGLVFGIIALIMSWLSFECVHYHWELSWPFMNLGNWLGQLPKWIQWYEYTGVLGGTFWILLVNVLLYVVISKLLDSKLKMSLVFLVIVALVMFLPVYISKNIYKNQTYLGEEKTFLVVQPNIDPYTEKYNASLFEQQNIHQIELAQASVAINIDCIIFPESSFPAYLDEGKSGDDAFVEVLVNELVDSFLIPVIGGFYSYRLNGVDTSFFNTAFMINSETQIQLYHKSKLVVGVEKMPFEKYFSFLKTWNLDFGGYTTSLGIDSDRKVFTLVDKGVSIAPVICYESVYGQFVSEFVKNGANFITVITNDAWWGDTPGYKQHLMHSKLRAIETRRAVVRSANTGVSCFINQKGEIISEIAPWKEETLTGTVTSNDQLTFYAKNGDYIGIIAVFLMTFLIVFAIVKNRWQKRNILVK